MWLVKKILINKINSLLKKYKDDVETMRKTLTHWTTRIKKILSCFESMLEKLEDNELDANEINETADEVSKLIKEW